ncbi:MAG: NADH-quinone oxidoreductase subunit J [Actinobacteria bacterium]|nr:MAG: NADH-quinone oxidoreductase subunit J [Actinomycetota bacterium]TML75162.1 MAG: NADH-quinone oxidoreductase subunit J [Actinomycetota bacterium]
MLLEQILFFVAAAGAIGGALGVVLLRNPFFSVLALVAHLVALALLFLLLRAEFVAAAQLVVYAGAVMVLYVFVVAYIGGVEETVGGEGLIGRTGPVFAGALLAELTIAVVGSGLGALNTRGAHVPAGFGSPGAIGKLLLEKFLIPFEAASFLLLVAAVGAIVLARRRRGLEEVDEEELPERAGRAPVGDPSGRAGAPEEEAEGPPPGTAEGRGDPTPERSEVPA